VYDTDFLIISNFASRSAYRLRSFRDEFRLRLQIQREGKQSEFCLVDSERDGDDMVASTFGMAVLYLRLNLAHFRVPAPARGECFEGQPASSA
jgi:hypothetical protein